MLEVLDEAADRGLINDLPEKLEHLEHRTSFYIGNRARLAIESMKQRDLQRKQAQEEPASTPDLPQDSAEERNQD